MQRKYDILKVVVHRCNDFLRQFETFLTKNKTKGEIHMRNKKVLFITQAALIAAIYVVLTCI